MKRRDVLKRAAALGVAGAAAGCLSNRQAPGGDSDDGGNDTETTTKTTTTTTQQLAIASREVVESSGNCGQENRAAVSFEDGTVVVEGAIPTSDPCHEAKMSDSQFDTQSRKLDLTMSAVETDAEACQQCLGKVTYRAEISFTGGSPKEVSVAHSTMSGTETVQTAENPG